MHGLQKLCMQLKVDGFVRVLMQIGQRRVIARFVIIEWSSRLVSVLLGVAVSLESAVFELAVAKACAFDDIRLRLWNAGLIKELKPEF